MKNKKLIFGVDPGLVHTGVVSLAFNEAMGTVFISHNLVIGPDAAAVDAIIATRQRDLNIETGDTFTFIEAYRPRSNYNSDIRMVEAVDQIRKAVINPRVLPNTGVKKVVTEDLMRVLKVYDFSTPSHHQDLRSAARIALLGMMKDPELNALLSLVVKNHLISPHRKWNVLN